MQPVKEQGLLPSQVAEFCANTPTAKEPNQLDQTLNKQVAYMQQIQELRLDKEFDEGLGKESSRGLIQEVDKEMADLWMQEWVGNKEWEPVHKDDKGMEGSKSGDEENNAALTAEELVEYNNNRWISAQSKGKGLATH
ncbi:hypothetical protein RHS03_07865, partial [Rhizoctonia solani]